MTELSPPKIESTEDISGKTIERKHVVPKKRTVHIKFLQSTFI